MVVFRKPCPDGTHRHTEHTLLRAAACCQIAHQIPKTDGEVSADVGRQSISRGHRFRLHLAAQQDPVANVYKIKKKGLGCSSV